MKMKHRSPGENGSSSVYCRYKSAQSAYIVLPLVHAHQVQGRVLAEIEKFNPCE